MSTAKRSKRRQPEAKSASPLPASKRLKTTKDAHVPPARSGLGYLVNENVRNGQRLGAKLTNGVPPAKTSRLDESRAVIAPNTDDDRVGGTQDTAIDISSAEDPSSEDEDDEDNIVGGGRQNGAAAEAGGQIAMANGLAPGIGGYQIGEDAVAGAEDVDMGGAEDDDEAEDPSFGDMLQARHPQPIDVQAAFPNPMADRQALIPASGTRVFYAPSGTSLGTVLTQALKTNDKDLMESCFQTTDLPSIRATIQRLQSQHVATLLQRLAERIHQRPGRTGNLMVWVQWSLVAHGGYLATQPDLVRKLKSLSKVIRDRADGLQPLLHLKGKLDMLSAQLELRRNMQAASRAANADDEDEEGVVYVEGRDDDMSDSDAASGDEDMDTKMLEPPRRKADTHKPTPFLNGTTAHDNSESEDESDEEDELPNGVAVDEDEDSSDAEEDEPGLFDIEAEDTDDDEDDEEEDGSEGEEGDSAADSESESDVSESEDSGVKQAKPAILNRKR